MKIVFFEVENWAHSHIKEKFPESIIVKEPLDEKNVEKYEDTEILSTFIYSDLSEKILTHFPKLKFIATRSTGFEHIDMTYCKTHNIIVSNIPTYGKRTVAEHTFALILALTRKLYPSFERTKEDGNFSIIGLRGTDLYEKTIGIIGLGNIGREVAKIAFGFGMNIVVYTNHQDEALKSEYHIDFVSLDELLEKSDVITLHLPLTDSTKHIININNVDNIKKGAYLINTARGGLIETEAILHGLDEGIFAGVGLDVLENEHELSEEMEFLSTHFRKKVDYENLVYDHILLKHPKTVVTPHNAFNSVESLQKIHSTTFENISHFLSGSPINCAL